MTAGNRAYVLQETAETAEGLSYALRGWLPVAQALVLQTMLVGESVALRTISADLMTVAPHLYASWVDQSQVQLLVYDKVGSRPAVQAPAVPLHLLAGDALAMETAVNGTRQESFAAVQRTLTVRLIDAASRVSDAALVLSATNMSAYGGAIGSQRDVIWQQDVQYLLVLISNGGRGGNMEVKAMDAIGYGRSAVASSATAVGSVSLVFTSVVVGILVCIIVLLYLPALRRIDNIRNLTVQRFLRIPLRIIQLLHKQSVQRVKKFSKMEVCDECLCLRPKLPRLNEDWVAAGRVRESPQAPIFESPPSVDVGS